MQRRDGARVGGRIGVPRGFNAVPGGALDIGRLSLAPQRLGNLVDGGGDVGADHHALGMHDLWTVQAWGGVLNDVTQAFAQAGGVVDRGDGIRVDRDVKRWLRRHRNAQTARRQRDFFKPGAGMVRRGIRIARRGPARRIEKGRTVAHRARDDMTDRGATPAFAARRAHRRAGARGLQTIEAAAGRRDADRAAAIGCMGHRHDAGSDCGSGAAA